MAGFDFGSSKVDQPFGRQLATLSFMDTAQNVVLIGDLRTGKPICSPHHRGVGHRRKKGRLLALSLPHMDLVILDELGKFPFSLAGGALLFHLLSKSLVASAAKLTCFSTTTTSLPAR
jgi:hypothetical protein